VIFPSILLYPRRIWKCLSKIIPYLFLKTAQSTSVYAIGVKYSPLEYHKPKSKVPFRHLNIIFISCTWVSFGAIWNCATNPTSYIMYGLDAITYSRLTIIDLYNVSFASRDSSFFINLQPVTIGVLTSVQSSILNFFNFILRKIA